MYMGRNASPNHLLPFNDLMIISAYQDHLGLMSLMTNQPRGCLRKANFVLIFEGQTVQL